MREIRFGCFLCGAEVEFKRMGVASICNKCGNELIISSCDLSNEKLKCKSDIFVSCSGKEGCSRVRLQVITGRINLVFKTLEEANRARGQVPEHYFGRLLIVIEKGIDGKCSDCFFKTGCGFSVEVFRKKAKDSGAIIRGV
ncbi:hypothetical protein ACFL16_00895 [Patescibacteria group bacterium]